MRIISQSRYKDAARAAVERSKLNPLLLVCLFMPLLVFPLVNVLQEEARVTNARQQKAIGTTQKIDKKREKYYTQEKLSSQLSSDNNKINKR